MFSSKSELLWYKNIVIVKKSLSWDLLTRSIVLDKKVRRVIGRKLVGSLRIQYGLGIGHIIKVFQDIGK